MVREAACFNFRKSFFIGILRHLMQYWIISVNHTVAKRQLFDILCGMKHAFECQIEISLHFELGLQKYPHPHRSVSFVLSVIRLHSTIASNRNNKLPLSSDSNTIVSVEKIQITTFWC